MSRMRGGVNRTALVCAAAALLGAGAVLASATAPVRDRLPSGSPRLGADRVWLDADDLSRWRGHDGWTALVVAALSVGVLLFLGWALAQLRGGRLRELPLGRPDITLSGAALAAAMTERTRAVQGVAHARVRLRGSRGGTRRAGRRSSRRGGGRRGLRARITVVLAPDSAPEDVLRRLARETVAEARAAVAPRPLRVDVRLTTRSSARVTPRHPARRTRPAAGEM
ncbi:alkaline shock response membrane anchor protein AmaP [Streptomyces sp. NPDC048518]|uniref:alkaline shock response membrane anchor protein AmaP n=1 Tax=Streptomyces sp. NPDC048518 TaxID=3155029 RepID=UPI0033D2EB8E